MIVTLTFDTADQDQRHELEEIQAVRKLAGAVTTFLQTTREIRKYRQGISDETLKIIEELRNEVYTELEGYEP